MGLLIFIGVGAPAFLMFLFKYVILSTNLVWKLLCTILTIAGIVVVLSDKAQNLIRGIRESRSALAFVGLLSLILVTVSPVVGIALLGLELGLVLLVVVIMNVFLLMAFWAAALILCGLIKNALSSY